MQLCGRRLQMSAVAGACCALRRRVRPAPAVRCGGEAGACGGALRHATAERCGRRLRCAAAGVCGALRPAPAAARCGRRLRWSAAAGACGGALRPAPVAERCSMRLRCAAAGACGALRPAPAVRCDRRLRRSAAASVCGALRRCDRRLLRCCSCAAGACGGALQLFGRRLRCAAALRSQAPGRSAAAGACGALWCSALSAAVLPALISSIRGSLPAVAAFALADACGPSCGPFWNMRMLLRRKNGSLMAQNIVQATTETLNLKSGRS